MMEGERERDSTNPRMCVLTQCILWLLWKAEPQAHWAPRKHSRDPKPEMVLPEGKAQPSLHVNPTSTEPATSGLGTQPSTAKARQQFELKDTRMFPFLAEGTV